MNGSPHRPVRFCRRTLAVALAASLTIVAAATSCTKADDAQPLAYGQIVTTTDAGATMPASLYTASVTDSTFGGTVEVATALTRAEDLRRIFDAMRRQHPTGDRWEVRIHCARGPNELAAGRFATTDRGKALTGLSTPDAVAFTTTGLAC